MCNRSLPVRSSPRRARGAACLVTLLLAVGAPAYADDAEALRAQSPYFVVGQGDPGVDRLPLKNTQVEVRIAGVVADVTVTQHYRNEGQRPLEARYVFPGSTQAAVHAMQVRLGDRLLKADIREKQQAQIEYQAAKSEGKTAALLEQHRPNVFQMNVANILPGDDVAVELHYTELLVPTEGHYQFVFPTVVGPRYQAPASNPTPSSAGGSTKANAESWPAMPYLSAGGDAPAPFDLRVTMDTPVSVKSLQSPSHAVTVTGLGQTHATVALRQEDSATNKAPVANNRDFILDYALAGEQVASGLLLHRGEKPGDENFFLAMVEPPRQVAPAQINPREYLFVVDISGSMHGQPLNTAKTLLRQLIGGLRPTDRFNVMLFSGSNAMLAPEAVAANRANIEQAITTIDRVRGSGSTEIVPALKRIAALPKPSELSRTVVIVTDGYVTVEKEVFELVRQHLDRSNVFAFGIGESVNRHLIEGIARAGQGEPFIVTKPEMAQTQAERLRKMIDSPVLTQVKARFNGLDVYDVEPKVLPDVLGGRPVVVTGKWRGEAQGEVVIEGQGAQGAYREALPVAASATADTPALRQLWARRRIAALGDQEALEGGNALKSEITQLGLRYSLLTDYTSFIAVDKIVRVAQPTQAASVDQPSPLPQGVSELAVPTLGAEVPGTPEPETWLALIVTMTVGGLAVARRGRRSGAR